MASTGFFKPVAPIKIMPCLDIMAGRVVKGVHFVDLIDAGDPVACAVAYEKAGADEIGFLDINATVENRRTTLDVLQQVASAVGTPVTAGGGIRTLQDAEDAFSAGAAKISISSAAFRDPGFVAEAVKTFGGERIVLAIDADVNEALPSKREVFVDGGRTPTGVDAVEFAKKMAGFGVGGILPTSRAGDGSGEGYDLLLTAAIADGTGLPTIASGGAGTLAHFYEGVVFGHASTLLAATLFHFGTFTVRQVKAYLMGMDISVANAEGITPIRL